MYDYFHAEQPDAEVTTATYADNTSHEPLEEFWWNHTMSDIYMALLRAGLRVESFREFPYSAYRLNTNMIQQSPGKWVHRTLGTKIPYMFSMKARR